MTKMNAACVPQLTIIFIATRKTGADDHRIFVSRF